MSETDIDVDGRLHDGWQYRIKFRDGSVEHARDSANLSSILARLGEARRKNMPGGSKSFEDVCLTFSGARAVEGVDPEGKVEIGPVRGKGSFVGLDVVGVSYSSTDGTEVSNQAYEAAVALLDVQRAALARFQVAGGNPEGADKSSEGATEELLGAG